MAGKSAVIADAGEEADLVARAVAGDETAVRAIVRQHNQRLYRLARGVIRDDAEAEDVVQQAYVHAFTHLAGFRGEARLSTWLSRIVLNESLGRLRRRSSLEIAAIDEGPATSAEVIRFPHAGVDPERGLAQREIQALLERAVDQLPDAFRTVLVARVIEEMSVEETAELFGLQPATVKTRLHRARRLVRKALEAELGTAITGAFPFNGWRCERMADLVVAELAQSA